MYANNYMNGTIPRKRKQARMKVFNIFVNGNFMQNSIGATAQQAIQLFAVNKGVKTGPAMSVGQCGQNMQYCAKQMNGMYPCGLRAKCTRKTVVNSAMGNIIAVEAM